MKDYQDPSRSVEHQSQPITTNGSSEKIIDQILGAIGITINGSEDFDMQVHDARMFDDIIRRGSLGLGESYMAGWWDCKRLDIFMDKILTAKIDCRFKLKKRQILQLYIHKYINLQSAKRAFQVGQKHYDIGNDLFTRMLDTSMSYSCGYWKNADTLEQAQYNKIDLICQKLDLKPGMKLLDIGCGWGYLAAFAAKNYSVEVVGVTVSKEQHQYAKRKYKDLDIDFQLQDYRKIKGTFDRVVSVGMLEHVGYKNYKTYMSTINQSLSPNGLALIHSIISNKSKYTTDPWISKYIFVNGFIPSVHQISKSAEKYFVLEDVHNLGIYYDKTLMAWDKNFVDTYDQISDKYDEKFYRMWRYYLLACAALFRSRSAQVMQFVYSKGLREGYQPVR